MEDESWELIGKIVLLVGYGATFLCVACIMAVFALVLSAFFGLL